LLADLNAHGLLTRDRLAKLDVAVLKALLDRAVAAAAITCSRAGANPPTQRELEEFLGQ
jgi:fructokinase